MIFVTDISKNATHHTCMILESRIRVSSHLIREVGTDELVRYLGRGVDLPKVIFIREEVVRQMPEILAMTAALSVPLVIMHAVANPGDFSQENVPGVVAHIERPVNGLKISEALDTLLNEETFASLVLSRTKVASLAVA